MNAFEKLQKINVGTLNTILKGLPNLEALSIWNKLILSGTSHKKLFKMPPKLNKLRIPDIESAAWRHLLAQTAADCPNLSELHIEKYGYRNSGPAIYKEVAKFKKYKKYSISIKTINFSLKSLITPLYYLWDAPFDELINGISGMRNIQYLELNYVNEAV